MTDGPSIKNLSEFFKCSTEHGKFLPWCRSSSVTLVCYVIKFCSGYRYRVLCDTIERLNLLVNRYNLNDGDEKVVLDMFANSFIPKVRVFFMVPKLNQLPYNSKHLKRNEVLAGFMNFLRQILNHEAKPASRRVGREECDLLHAEIELLIAVLDDILFRCTLQKEVNNTLNELEILANEIGWFVYSCVFSLPRMDYSRFQAAANALLKKIWIANENIKLGCIKIHKLTMLNPTSGRGLIGSFFIIDSLIDDIENMMMNDHDLLNLDAGINGQIGTLLDELKFPKPFLKNILVLHDAEILKEPLLRVRDLAYEAEYLIHSHIAQNIPKWYLGLRLPAILHQFKLNREQWSSQHVEPTGGRLPKKSQGGTPMSGLLTKKRKIFSNKRIYLKYSNFASLLRCISFRGFQNSGSSSDHAGIMKTVMSDTKGCSSEVSIGTPTNDGYYPFSGLEDEMTRILRDLTGEPKTRAIISIHGMAGLGKTTMAHKLYNCRYVCNYFDRRVWCVVSQAYSVRELMIHILKELACELNDEEISKLKNDKLSVLLHKSLKQWRYLIVLDDVWDVSVILDLQRYFPDDRNGSRILLTSRIKAMSPINVTFHTLPTLTKDQCWDLLNNKVFQNETCPQDLISIGKRIAAKCHGLPLAVVVAAGILVNLDKQESVWRRVETHLEAYLLDEREDYVNVLELSYKYLPHYIKPCFLYLGVFHKDTEISVKKLLWLWIAEGFIPKEKERSREELAEVYLLDLINRSLVLTTKTGTGGGIKACRVHDLLRDLCVRKAHEENFLKSNNNGFSIYEKHERFYDVHSTAPSLGRSLSRHVRSLKGCIQDDHYYLSKMILLRVVNDMNIPKVLPLPGNLRYLGSHEMPKNIAENLINLEFLCIETRTIVYIPPEILQMVKLRHLVISDVARFQEHSDSSIPTNLKSLSVAGIYRQADEEILKSSHLQKLKCLCGGVREFPALCSLTKLESLKVVFEYVPARTLLSEANLPFTLRKLHISRSVLPLEKLSIIGKLPNLHVLKLGPHAFVGKVWETRVGEFQNLRFLKVELYNLKKWSTSSSDHFPKLERLVLVKCYDLLEIPCELGNIDALQRIELMDCGNGAYMSALEIEEEKHDYGDEELQVLITSSKWTNEQLGHKYREWKEAKTLEEDGTEE